MSEPVAGKFLLEILTKGMYSNPMHIYREYIQNASDSIDRAIDLGLITPADAMIHIDIDMKRNSIVIRDNGIGIPQNDAQIKLLNVGASDKDGISERGFRGIGRLGGLAYAEQVQFITSAYGDKTKTVMTCDCVRMQQLLQKSNDETSDVMETFKAISRFDILAEAADSHYFEVRAIGVPPESGLLDESAVIQYMPRELIMFRHYFEENGITLESQRLYRRLSEVQKKELMDFVSHPVSELKLLPCPKIFSEILPYYLIKYNAANDRSID